MVQVNLVIAFIYTLFNACIWTDCADPDEMLKNMVSYQGLHCLPLIQQFLDTTSVCNMYLLKF